MSWLKWWASRPLSISKTSGLHHLSRISTDYTLVISENQESMAEGRTVRSTAIFMLWDYVLICSESFNHVYNKLSFTVTLLSWKEETMPGFVDLITK